MDFERWVGDPAESNGKVCLENREQLKWLEQSVEGVVSGELKSGAGEDRSLQQPYDVRTIPTLDEETKLRKSQLEQGLELGFQSGSLTSK